jgi:hypothetical protein
MARARKDLEIEVMWWAFFRKLVQGGAELRH